MHPGPIIRGLELTAGVADGPQSAILEQVRHGVAIRMAVVERALTRDQERKAAHERHWRFVNGHLIDPAAGVDAPKDILFKDGRVAEIAGPGKLKAANGAEMLDASGPDGCSGAGGYSCSPARAGTGLQGDHRHRNRGRGGGRIHRCGRHAQHDAGKRLAGDHTLDAGAGARRGGARVSDWRRQRADQRARRSTTSQRSSQPAQSPLRMTATRF